MEYENAFKPDFGKRKGRIVMEIFENGCLTNLQLLQPMPHFELVGYLDSVKQKMILEQTMEIHKAAVVFYRTNPEKLDEFKKEVEQYYQTFNVQNNEPANE